MMPSPPLPSACGDGTLQCHVCAGPRSFTVSRAWGHFRLGGSSHQKLPITVVSTLKRLLQFCLADFTGVASAPPAAKERLLPGDVTNSDSESDAEGSEHQANKAANGVWKGPDPRPKATVRAAAANARLAYCGLYGATHARSASTPGACRCFTAEVLVPLLLRLLRARQGTAATHSHK